METEIIVDGTPIQFERYLARGNFGSVYVGYYGLKKVAVKVSKTNLKNEYECLKKISTPIYYSDTILVTEFYGEDTLKKLLDRVKKIPFCQKEVIMIDLLKQVSNLHNLNICHHDIKTENVIMNQLNPYLIDFGFASYEDCHFRKQGKGSIHYVPPECFTNQMGIKSDVWALGVLFYELIANDFPFFGKDELAMKHEIIKKSPTPFAKRHEVTKKWEQIIMSMLTKDVTKRPSCQDILLLLNN